MTFAQLWTGEEYDDDITEVDATGIDLENENTGSDEVRGHRGGQENLEPVNLVIDEDNTLDEVVEINPDTEQSTDHPRGRSMRRSMRRSQPSPSPVRSPSPQRARRGSGGGRRQVSTASPSLRRTTMNRTPAGRTTNRQVATNSSLILITGSKRKLMNSSDYSMEDRSTEYEETHLDLLLKIDELKATSMRENKTISS